MATVTDPFGGLPETYFSYAAVYDTGSSANLISATEANGRNLPTTGESFTEQGIGGMQTFNVSQPTTLKIAPMSVGWTGSEEPANFASYGNYKFELCQSDPSISYPGYPGILFPVETNTIGTPVLNQYVMHVQPNNTPIPYEDFFPVPVSYMQTTLLSPSPSTLSGLNASPSQLVLVPSARASARLHVPLVY